MYYGKTHADNYVPWWQPRTRTLIKLVIVITLLTLCFFIFSSFQSAPDELLQFSSSESSSSSSDSYTTRAKKPKLTTRLEKQQYKRIILLEQEIHTLKEQARNSNKFQSAMMRNSAKKRLLLANGDNSNNNMSTNEHHQQDSDSLEFGHNNNKKPLTKPPEWLTLEDFFEQDEYPKFRRTPLTKTPHQQQRLSSLKQEGAVLIQDFTSKQFYVNVVRGISFVVEDEKKKGKKSNAVISKNESHQKGNSNDENDDDEDSSDSDSYHSPVSFNKRVTKCFANLAKGLLKSELTDEVKNFVQSQLVFLRYELENASINEQHEEWIVRPYKFVEKNYYTEARMIRAIGACLLGGGLGVDKPHGQAHWAERGGGGGGVTSTSSSNSITTTIAAPSSADMKSTSAPFLSFSFRSRVKPTATSTTSTSSSSSNTSSSSTSPPQQADNNIINNDNHPLFFPLHGGVSPRRLIKQSFRAAEFLGFGTPKSSRLERTVKAFVKRSRSGREKSKIIVDLGCGHGAMLAAMCPPHPRLWCYGIDFTEALIERGRRAFPHLDLRAGISAPHLPSGSADAVLSNGVAGILRLSANCLHLQEIIRLLRPGKGVGLIWQLSSTRWARFHPAFFADAAEFFLNETRFQNASKSSDEDVFEFIPDFGRVMVDPFFGTSNDEQNQRNDDHLYQNATTSNTAATSDFPTSTSSSPNQTQEQQQQTPHQSHQEQQKQKEERQTNPAFPNRMLRLKSHRQFMSRCPGNLGRYLSRVDIIATDPHSVIYTPAWDSSDSSSLRSWAGAFGVRIFRNEKLFDSEKSVKEDDVRFTGTKTTEKNSKYRDDDDSAETTVEPNQRHEDDVVVDDNNNRNEGESSQEKKERRNKRKNSPPKEMVVEMVKNSPLGLRKMLFPEKFDFFTHKNNITNISIGQAFGYDPFKFFNNERSKYQYAVDTALRCRHFVKGTGGGSNGGKDYGWCPKSRVRLGN